ncbi:MAG: type II/IV secretion system protein [Candidatus Hydrothermarchaeota archaeon]|nr:MAG: type II/IV secretion system protein [Candidatus Hydrothermarchaeota archaeon]
MKLLGEILVERGFCSEADVKRALEIQKEFGGRIGSILVNLGAITEKQLISALAEQFRLPSLSDAEDLKAFPLKGIETSFLIENEIYPIQETEEEIHVVTNDPLKIDLFSFLERKLGKTLKIVLASEEEIRKLRSFLEAEIEAEEEKSTIDIDEEVERLKDLASEAPVIKLVNNLISKAVESRASDIHFEAYRNEMRVRFRIDGILRTTDIIPNRLKLAVIARLKLLSGMNIAENRLPQDGRISLRVAGKEIDIRASSTPTSFGESFVLRLLGKEDIRYSLDYLGFYDDHLFLIKQIIKRPYGIFLTTGPTGSGKTTTLYSILTELNTDGVKIITVEDPVEYELPGINQIQVHPEIGYTFAHALRSILRQDPDIAMVGEIRDPETAEIAIQASLTGHLVLSTLHTNTALGSITRLLNMGIKLYLLRASITGVMAQRLVRKLCPYCSEPWNVPEEIINLYKLNDLISKYKVTFTPKRPVGCKECHYTGYIGRTAIAEVIPFDDNIQEEFEKDKNFNDPNKYGYRTMLQDGLLKFAEGRTSLDEVLRVI